MGFLMMDVEEIHDLRVREEKLTKYLGKIEQWEAKLILTSECWQGEYPQLTRKLYDEWLELQKERSELLDR